MATYRNQLPQLSNKFFIVTGGVETSLIFKQGVDIQHYTTFHHLKDASVCEWIKNYFRTFIGIAKKYNAGIILETSTWRANPDWTSKFGYTIDDTINVNQKAVQLLSDLRDEFKSESIPMVIDGCMGPRGDGYSPTVIMSIEEAQEYHSTQLSAFSKSNADMVTAYTLTYPEEAIGIVKAAKAVEMPVVISFTINTDGRLPSGHSLKEAILQVEEATQQGPIYYMVNCIHPSYLEQTLITDEPWTTRIHGVKGNASKKSHAELDDSKELDSGNPAEFGQVNMNLMKKFKNINVISGCCGTDTRHAEENCKWCLSIFDK